MLYWTCLQLPVVELLNATVVVCECTEYDADVEDLVALPDYVEFARTALFRHLHCISGSTNYVEEAAEGPS